jgi:branched-chain amino acid transport system ATP-binding protein
MSLLQTRRLRAFYGDFQALFDIDFDIAAGETVAIIGANGAGKTTFLRTIAGALPCASAMVTYDSQPIGQRAAHDIVRLGIAMVPEGRKLFPSLSVEENLQIGGDYSRRGPWTLARVYELFPMLAERRATPSTALSGGQQQMVAIGRALMSNPRLLLCDELSLGLAPVVVREIYERLAKIAAEGTTLIIVEQDVNRALAAADRFYCFQKGHVSLTGAAKSVDRQAITAAYFGIDTVEPSAP